MSNINGTTWILSDSPIRRGYDWGSGSGHLITCSENISSVDFSISFKRSGVEIIALTEGDGITHDGNYNIYLKIQDADTLNLSTGILIGELQGDSAGDISYYGTIQLEVI